MEIHDIEEVKGIDKFKAGPDEVLKRSLEGLLSAKIALEFSPIEAYKMAYGIDISINPDKYVYIPQAPNTIMLLAYVYGLQKDVKYFLGITVTSPLVRSYDRRFLDEVRSRITNHLTSEGQRGFRFSAFSGYGESLVQRIISKHLGDGSYDVAKLSYLIEKMMNLRSTTFEGKYFSTGVILTNSVHRFNASDFKKDHGNLIRLSEDLSVKISDKQDKRFWYLADGIDTYFVTDLKHPINHLFVCKDENLDLTNKLLFIGVMEKHEALLRVMNGRELSIISSRGYEFIHQQNQWRFRDYRSLKKYLADIAPHIAVFVDTIVNYALEASKSDISSILWFPKDIDKIDDIIQTKTKNKLTKPGNDINISNPLHKPLIKRLMSSDGATVIDNAGNVVYYGTFANISKIESSGVRGTGESAAELLATNGLAIKISQDGLIKISAEGQDGVLVF